MNRTVRIASVVASISLLITSCSQAGEEGSASATLESSQTQEALWPFTQLPGPDDAAEKPVIAIKIDNDSGIRPQYGLDMADLVFEELVEGGITRFVAIYQSEIPAEVGPVRSGRHVDASLVSPIANYFVFSGAARATLKYFSQTIPQSVVLSTEDAPGMKRTNYHRAPHNLFIFPQELIDSGTAAVSKSIGFFVKPMMNTEPSGTEVTKVELKFSQGTKPNWTWDAATNLWLRDDGNKPHMAMSGKQLSTTSLVVLRVTETDAGYKGSNGGYVPRSVVTGSGQGYLVVGNLMTEVTWSKADDASQMTLTDSAGNVLHPVPGKTWVELITTSGDVGFTSAGTS